MPHVRSLIILSDHNTVGTERCASEGEQRYGIGYGRGLSGRPENEAALPSNRDLSIMASLVFPRTGAVVRNQPVLDRIPESTTREAEVAPFKEPSRITRVVVESQQQHRSPPPSRASSAAARFMPNLYLSKDG
jgi:hypothetical protein